MSHSLDFSLRNHLPNEIFSAYPINVLYPIDLNLMTDVDKEYYYELCAKIKIFFSHDHLLMNNKFFQLSFLKEDIMNCIKLSDRHPLNRRPAVQCDEVKQSSSPPY